MRNPALVLLLASLLMIESACGGDTVPPPSPPETATGPRVRVLGTAQDGGFPHAACDCHRCSLARRDPRVQRRVASLAVIVPPKVYLIDASPDVRQQIAALSDVRDRPDGAAGGGVDRAPVDGIFLTHAHIGHYLGLAFFGFEAIHTHDLPVYSTASMGEFLAANGPWDQLLRLENIRTVILTAGGEGVDLGAGQLGGLGSGELDFVQVVERACLAQELHAQQLRVSADDGQHVVEVVCNAASQPADRFHALGRAHFLLELPVGRQVVDRQHHPFQIARVGG